MQQDPNVHGADQLARTLLACRKLTSWGLHARGVSTRSRCRSLLEGREGGNPSASAQAPPGLPHHGGP
eukprot:6119808-Prorocentrum_lima.AAC.1